MRSPVRLDRSIDFPLIGRSGLRAVDGKRNIIALSYRTLVGRDNGSGWWRGRHSDRFGWGIIRAVGQSEVSREGVRSVGGEFDRQIAIIEPACSRVAAARRDRPTVERKGIRQIVGCWYAVCSIHIQS